MKRIFVIACLLFLGCSQGADIPIGTPLAFPVESTKSVTMEQFGLTSDYAVQQPDVRSKIDPSLLVRGPVYFMCPTSPDLVLPFKPEHGVPFECDDHAWVVYGNSLFLLGYKKD